MTRRIHRKEAAWRDLDELAAFIQRDSPQSALRFLEAADKAFELLARAPELGTRCAFQNPALSELRMWTIQGFQKYVVFYRPIEQGVEIVRVLHGARDIAAIFEAEGD